MKALVLSVVFALTSVVNAVSGNNVKDFAYNSEKQENGVETQTEMEPGQQPLRKTVLPQLQLHR